MIASLTQHLTRIQERRATDAATFETLDEALCMLCGAYGTDKRNLRIAAFYDLQEVVPELLDLTGPDQACPAFYLRMCKSCRARLLRHLATWRAECVALQGTPKDHDGYLDEDADEDHNIPVRMHGITVLLTAEEYTAYCATEEDRTP